MNVSETLLSLVAFRLVVLVAFVATAQALPTRSHHDNPVSRAPGAVTVAAACMPATHGVQHDVQIHDMLRHD
ncbi:hypothetical protein [Methylobacterium oxalidis]|uniref:Uncharacterized protein n=1 Tax=Methylobacterium oxalidis TaxID=944322 RepID=A0A512J9P6_9HYPH|nr:hypothetical protein [Methylobacterium oxalidis]GEP06684.1 hypothetical protein MOX02_47220 [Methylobacterium oxalidis]GJE32931.1 hypothetical protein LDDCCGHA_3128 [Methylobacterium oxalidis]GLS67306.1 hypothetical protein GCM10007888_56890 [Methylobacterium oxalidis]